MSSKHKRSKMKWSLPVAIGLGLGVGCAVMIALSGILAWLIISQKLDISAMGVGAGFILVLASAAGAWMATVFGGEKRLQSASVFAAAFFAILLSATALLFGGQYSGVPVYGICILCGTGGVVLLGLLPKKARFKGRKMKAYR